MLAVKKLADIHRASLESGQCLPTHKGSAPLHLLAFQQCDFTGERSSSQTPSMTTFQDNELCAELQTSTSHSEGCEDRGTVKDPAGLSQSQDSIDTRFRGFGHTQEPPAGCRTPQKRSQENFDENIPQRNLPDGWDQRPQQQPLPKQVPFGTATVFKYQCVPDKPHHLLKGLNFLHAPCGSTDQNLSSTTEDQTRTLKTPQTCMQTTTRCALSDGEPDEDDNDESALLKGSMPSYATLTRKPGRSYPAHLPSSPEKNGNLGRSQSFAVRAKKKGPPPPPPKRLSSVSSPTGTEPGTVFLEDNLEEMCPQGPKPDPVEEPDEAAGVRRRVQSECFTEHTNVNELHQDLKHESKEEESKGHTLVESSSPQNSSNECIPFAEEGNLTIKQRPKAPGPPRAQAVLEPPDTDAAQNSEVPEFNLKESDTVKRRHKPKDKEQEGGSSSHEGSVSESDCSPPLSQCQWESSFRTREAALERPPGSAPGSPIKPPLSAKPPLVAPKPVRHSLMAEPGKTRGTGSWTWKKTKKKTTINSAVVTFQSQVEFIFLLS